MTFGGEGAVFSQAQDSRNTEVSQLSWTANWNLSRPFLCCVPQNLLSFAGLESRKKWKESIRCAEDNQQIWKHLQAEARSRLEDPKNRHVWIQWPVEDAGPTKFLGQITHYDPWKGMCNINYYYR